MKPDDGPWQLDRLSAEDAPELWRAVGAAKQQLPSANELAALAANLSLQGLPLSNPERLPPASRASNLLRKHWLVIGAAMLGATGLSVAVRHTEPETSSNRVAPAEPNPISISSAPTPSVRAPVLAHSSATALSPTLATPKPALPDVGPAAPGLASGGGAGAGAGVSGSPSPSRPALEPAPASTSWAAGSRASQSPSNPGQGSSLQARSKSQSSEIELLRDARLALQSSPALALGLTEQHSASFPHGTMVQERELIAISALARLGRHTAVLSRAQRFEHDFPSSPYRKQIAQMAQ